MEDGCVNGSSSRQLRSSSFVSKQEECGKQKHSSTRTGNSFVKVIGRDSSKQLQIPEEFIVNFGGNVPRRFIIENTTTKKCWRVEMEEGQDGRVYFGEGWNDFIEAHSLEVGSFLVFEYEEHSILQVKIYGKNGCERTLFESIDQLRVHKPEKTIEFEELKGSESDEYEKKRRKTRRLLPYELGVIKKRGVSNSYARTTEVSISANSVGFSTTLHKRKRHQFIRLAIPRAVTLAKRLSTVEGVILQVEQGKCWPVEVLHRMNNRFRVSYFSKGWKKFLEDNKIVGGDILSFTFNSDNIVQVHVMRTSQAEHQSGDEASGLLNMDCEDDDVLARTDTAEDKAIEASATTKRNSSEFKNCSFSVSWRETTTGSYLHIPKGVAEDQNLKSKDRVVVRDPEGKCWPFDVKIWYDGRVALTKGWREFWKGHDISTGDTLYFEFMSECLIQVAIDRVKPAVEGPDPAADGMDTCGTVSQREAVVEML